MDIGSAPTSGEDLQATNMQVNYDAGRATVEVQGTDLQPTDTEGWQAAGKRLRQRASPATSGESAPPLATPRASSAQYAKRVSARISRAARVPRTLPREEIKVVLRPRG